MLELISAHACHGGEQRIYRHDSQTIGLPMRFSVYLPPQALQPNANVPALFYLSGLTCTEETLAIRFLSNSIHSQRRRIWQSLLI